MAEAVGFEPTKALIPQLFSRQCPRPTGLLPLIYSPEKIALAGLLARTLRAHTRDSVIGGQRRTRTFEL